MAAKVKKIKAEKYLFVLNHDAYPGYSSLEELSNDVDEGDIVSVYKLVGEKRAFVQPIKLEDI